MSAVGDGGHQSPGGPDNGSQSCADLPAIRKDPLGCVRPHIFHDATLEGSALIRETGKWAERAEFAGPSRLGRRQLKGGPETSGMSRQGKCSTPKNAGIPVSVSDSARSQYGTNRIMAGDGWWSRC